MQCRFPFGTVHGFVWISLQPLLRAFIESVHGFFLAGQPGGVSGDRGLAFRGRYDNLKSVVIRRRPQTVFNSQFMDFAEAFWLLGLSLHPRPGQRRGGSGG